MSNTFPAYGMCTVLAVQGNRRYIKCLYVYNKVDILSIEEVDEIARRVNSLPVSCYMELNMDMLLSRMWDMMGLVRVYTKKVWNYNHTAPQVQGSIVFLDQR